MYPPHGTPPATVPGYGLAPPTELDFQLALCRHLGPQAGEDAWDAVCRAAALPAHGRSLTHPELHDLATRLMDADGAVAVVGRSMLIRVRAYALLARGVARAAASIPASPTPASPTPAPPPPAAPDAEAAHTLASASR